MTLDTLLIRFDEVLRECNPVNYLNLQDPLSEREIEVYMKKLGVEDESFKLLYSWKNGVSHQFGLGINDQIFDYGVLISLEALVNDMIEIEFQPWERNFIPIIANGSGEALLFNNSHGANYGKLHLYSVPEFFIGEPISYFDSITAMIKTTIKEYESGALFYDKKGETLEIKYKEANKLGLMHNPYSEIWKVR